MLASTSSAYNTRRTLTQAAVPNQSAVVGLRPSSSPRQYRAADDQGVCEGIVDIEEAVLLEGFLEDTNVLEVDDTDTSSHDVDEEVVLANVGIVYGELIRQIDEWHRGSRAARKRL